MGKHELRWGIKLLIWAAFLLILGAIGCTVLYSYTGVYERTRPEIAMDALMADMSEEDWRQTLGEPEHMAVFDAEKAESYRTVSGQCDYYKFGDYTLGLQSDTDGILVSITLTQ